MDAALKNALSNAKSVEDLKIIAHKSMFESGIFGETSDSQYAEFNRKNPYFGTLARNIFQSEGRSNTILIDESSVSGSKTFIFIIIGILVVALIAWFIIKRKK